MYTICKRFTFEAAHKLEGLPDGHPCMSLHGHSYKVDVYLENDELNEYGFVIDFNALNDFKDFISTYYDHNDKEGPISVSAEELAEIFYDVLIANPNYRKFVKKVRVWETEKCWAEYSE